MDAMEPSFKNRLHQRSHSYMSRVPVPEWENSMGCEQQVPDKELEDLAAYDLMLTKNRHFSGLCPTTFVALA